MKITINEIMFDTILKGVKHCIARDFSRPELSYIKIVVKDGNCTAYTLDGYRAAKVTVPCLEKEGDFTCFIKPVPFKVSKNGQNTVVIEADDKFASLEVATGFGLAKYTFVPPEHFSLDIEKIFDDAREHDREVGVNACYMAQAMKALSVVSQDNNNFVIIESKQSHTQAFVVRGKGKGFTCDQLILPIRVFEE